MKPERVRLAGAFLLAFLLGGCAHVEEAASSQLLNGGLALSTHVSQSFTAAAPRMSGIRLDLFFPDPGRPIREELYFDLYESGVEEPLVSQPFDIADCEPDGSCTVHFEPIADSAGREYAFELLLPVDLSVASRTCGFDCYPGGELRFLGWETGDDLAFSVIYLHSPLRTVRQGLEQILDALPLLVMILGAAAGMLPIWLILLPERIRRDPCNVLAAALPGSLLVISLAAAGVVLTLGSMPGWLVLAGAAAVCAAGWAGRGRRMLLSWKPKRKQAALFLGAGLALLALRMAFLDGLAFPPYFDSMHHYMMADDILHFQETPQAYYRLNRNPIRYYHFAFHFLAASLQAVSRQELHRVMMVLGQVLQTAAVMAVYFPGRMLTRSRLGGWAAVVFAGFGWAMPAAASSWGKYPAVFAAALVPLAMGMFTGWLDETQRGGAKEWPIRAGLLAGGAALAHTRSVFLLGMWVAAGWAAAGVVKKMDERLRRKEAGEFIEEAVFVVVLSAVLLTGLLPDLRLTGLRPVWDRYMEGNGLVVLGVLLLLLPFALKWCRISTLMVVLTAAGWIGLTAGPLPLVPTGALLDRELLEVMLYLPLALLGGLGAAGLDSVLAQFPRMAGRPARAVVIGLVAAVVVSGVVMQPGRPELEKVLAGEDDRAVIRWAEENLEPDSVVLIADTWWVDGSARHSDGGGWLRNLTDLDIEPGYYGYDFTDPVLLDRLRGLGVTVVYAGTTNESFPRGQLEALEDFTLLYGAGNAVLFELER
jgi:hypothetical protein